MLVFNQERITPRKVAVLLVVDAEVRLVHLFLVLAHVLLGAAAHIECLGLLACDPCVQLLLELPEACLQDVHKVYVEKVHFDISTRDARPGRLQLHRLADICAGLFKVCLVLRGRRIGNAVLVLMELLLVDLLFLQNAMVAQALQRSLDDGLVDL